MSARIHFLLTFQTPVGRTSGFAVLDFADLDAAYLDVCASMPETAAALLRDGFDPMVCSYLICDPAETVLMDVPFTELICRHFDKDPCPPIADLVVTASGGANRGRAARLLESARSERDRSRRAVHRSRTLLSETDRLMTTLQARLAASCERGKATARP